MKKGFFNTIKKFTGDNNIIEQFRNAVIENKLEEVKMAIEENHVDIDGDLTLGKLGSLSNFTPTWMKAMHEENADNLLLSGLDANSVPRISFYATQQSYHLRQFNRKPTKD